MFSLHFRFSSSRSKPQIAIDILHRINALLKLCRLIFLINFSHVWAAETRGESCNRVYNLHRRFAVVWFVHPVQIKKLLQLNKPVRGWIQFQSENIPSQIFTHFFSFLFPFSTQAHSPPYGMSRTVFISHTCPLMMLVTIEDFNLSLVS